MANHTEKYLASLKPNFKSDHIVVEENTFQSDLSRVRHSNLFYWLYIHTDTFLESIKEQHLGYDIKGNEVIYFQNKQGQITNGWRYKLRKNWPIFEVVSPAELLNPNASEWPVYRIFNLKKDDKLPVIIVEDPLLALVLNNFLDDYQLIGCPGLFMPEQYVSELEGKKVKILPDPLEGAKKRGKRLSKFLLPKVKELELMRWGCEDLEKLRRPIIDFIVSLVMVSYQEYATTEGIIVPRRKKSQIQDMIIKQLKTP